MAIAYQYGIGHFNHKFYQLRKDQNLTQTELGKKLGYDNHTIMRVENGWSGGKLDFWVAVQKFYGIPDSEMWSLMLGKEDT